jgi:hypothetical protein
MTYAKYYATDQILNEFNMRKDQKSRRLRNKQPNTPELLCIASSPKHTVSLKHTQHMNHCKICKINARGQPSSQQEANLIQETQDGV